ncbi:MAG: hypothetical protein AAF184_00015 [Pseudomonadota bacterium]
MTSPPIAPVSTQNYLLARLATVGDARRSARQLASDLSSRLPAVHWMKAIGELTANAWIAPRAKQVTLTDAGRREATQRFGDIDPDGGRWRRRVEPALCLGYRPDSARAARAARPDTLRAVLLTRLYALPLDEGTVTLSQATGALVLRGVVALAPPGAAVELRETARRISTDLAHVERLRQALAQLALEYGLASATPADPPSTRTNRARPASPSLRQFAQHVVNIARTAHTGPFGHKTPVDHVYDEYGRRHADAGTLAQFKARLLKASHAGLLALLPLDDPRALDAATRERSEIAVPSGALHFVERGL